METLWEILKYPDEFYPILKVKMAVKEAKEQIPPEIHWGFCYTMLHKVSTSFSLVIQQLDTELRNAACVFYLFLRAIDTVEDDMSIAADVKLPILRAFHQHIYDRDWKFSCGAGDCKILMDEFHHVSTAFLELDRHCQVIIEDMIRQTGEGMAKFICKEVVLLAETCVICSALVNAVKQKPSLFWPRGRNLLTIVTDRDYDEYCHNVTGPIGLGLSKLFHNPGLEDLAPEDLSNSVSLFLQKTNIIQDYLEDINDIPNPRKFWPREIWCKYVNQLEDLKCEENREKAVQCLNEMVTNSLLHVEDCLNYMSALHDHAIFRFSAIPHIMSIGTLALCYNNSQFFRRPVKMRRGLAAVIFYQTNTMSDVYGTFYDFLSLMKSKADKKDPNATKTLSKIEAIQSICKNSGTLKQRKLHIVRTKPAYSPIAMMMFFIVLAIIYTRLSSNQQNN